MLDLGTLPLIRWLVLFSVLVLLSAFFSGSETALLGTDWLRIRYLVRKGDKRAKVYQDLLNRKDILISTILVGNNLVNIAASAIATAFALAYFGQKGLAVATGGMTLLLLIVSEITPKTFASRHAEALALGVAPVFLFLTKVFYPVVVVTAAASKGIFFLFGAKQQDQPKHRISEEHIHTLVAEGAEAGVVAESRRRMVQGIFRIKNQTVREVMVPRVRVQALDVSTPLEKAVESFISTGYTRLPVYRENLDEIVGIAHARDALELFSKGRTGNLAAISREPFFVPESKSLESLLFEFQKMRTHIAVVVDEYGGVEGIITLEDIIEEIVGEIRDEHDMESDPIRFLPGGEAHVHGGVSIREVNERLKLKLPTDMDATLAGFVLTRLGHMPEAGEAFRYGDATFKVERTGFQRVLLVRVTPSREMPAS